MKLKICIIILLLSLVFFQCKKSTETRTTENKLSNVDVSNTSGLKNKKIEIPFYGKIELIESKKDSVKVFNGGDCEGSLSRYEIDKKFIAIDTTSCGDYGDTYTTYILDSLNAIELVYKKEMVMNKDALISSQLVINFNEQPVIAKTLIDTIYSGKQKVDKVFKNDTITEVLTSYEHWDMHYKDIWNYEDLEE